MKNIKLIAVALAGCLLLGGQAYGATGATGAKGAKGVGGISGVSGDEVRSFAAGAAGTLQEALKHLEDAVKKAEKLAKEQLAKIKDGVGNLQKNIKAMSYKNSSELDIISTPFLSFTLKLDGTGQGSDDKFTGISFILANNILDDLLKNIPDITVAGMTIPVSQVAQSASSMLAPVKNILDQIGKVISQILEVPLQAILKETFKTQGKFQDVPGTPGTKSLISTPAMEYFFRVALLAKDMNTKDTDGKPLMDKQAFGIELLTLTKKLIHTLGPKATFNDVLNQIPQPLEVLLSPVKNQIQVLWGELSDIVGFDFNSIATLPTLGNSDIKKIANIMGAICLDYYLSYIREKNLFLQTKEGKKAAATLAQNHNQKAFDAAFNAYKKAEFLKTADGKKATDAFNQSQDQAALDATVQKYINTNKQTAEDRFIALGKHLSAYKKIKDMILSKLSFLNPIIAPMTLNDFFPPDAAMVAQQKQDQAATDALNAALTGDGSGDGSSDGSDGSGDASGDGTTGDGSDGSTDSTTGDGSGDGTASDGSTDGSSDGTTSDGSDASTDGTDASTDGSSGATDGSDASSDGSDTSGDGSTADPNAAS